MKFLTFFSLDVGLDTLDVGLISFTDPVVKRAHTRAAVYVFELTHVQLSTCLSSHTCSCVRV